MKYEITEIITAEGLAEFLNVGINTVYDLLNEGKIKAFKIGRIWKIPLSSVMEYIYKSSHKQEIIVKK